MGLISELRRRNVFRVAIAYVVVAWLILQVGDTLAPALRLAEWVNTALAFFLILGLPIAIFFAWAYELTPEGIKGDKHVGTDKSITRNTGRKLDFAIIALLVVAIGFFAYDKFVLDPLRDAELVQATTDVVLERKAESNDTKTADKAIAVLPFADLSPEGDQEYFSDGMSEEILNLLTRVPTLRVTSRSSAFSFKGQRLEIPEIANRLSVAHILEGSVRKAGNRVRITAQLIEASTDSPVWSETYDRSLDDVFAIQDEIAAMVVEQLQVTLLGDTPHVLQTDPEAYSISLQARHRTRRHTVESYEQSIALYKQALAIDPNYANAWAGLAAVYSFQAGQGLRPFDESYTLAREAAENALAIDPDHASAHGQLGWIASSYDNDLAAAARHFERALELDPANVDILSDAGMFLASLGRPELAIAVNEFVAARDPLNLGSHGRLGMSYLYAGHWDDAIASFQTALRLSPGQSFFRGMIGIALVYKGEAAAALESNPEDGFIGMAMAYHALGDANASDAAVAELIENYGEVLAYQIAYVAAYRNEVDRAFEWLDKAVEYGDPGLADIATEPAFANLTSDPRWLPFLESIGKSPAQLDAISFEVQLPR